MLTINLFVYFSFDYHLCYNKTWFLLTTVGDGKAVTLMTSTLSYDARGVDEASAAEFLGILKGYLQSPASLLLPSQSSPRVTQAVAQWP